MQKVLVFRKIDQEEGFIGWERFLLSPPRPIARLGVPKFFKNGGGQNTLRIFLR
jgi:hypothetical protein